VAVRQDHAVGRGLKAALAVLVLALVALATVGVVQFDGLDGSEVRPTDQEHYLKVKRDPALWLAPAGGAVVARFDSGVCGDSGSGPHFTWYVTTSPGASRAELVADLHRRLEVMGWTDGPPEPVEDSDLEMQKPIDGHSVVVRARAPHDPRKSNLDISLDATAGARCDSE
jgi:hypothetical protein